MNIRFTALGIPAPAGSKKGFYNPKAGRVIITDDSKRSRPWKALVSDAALEAMNGGGLMRGPLSLSVTFFFSRPKGHYGSGSNSNKVRASAPAVPATRPDCTKLLRAVEDACNGTVWKDDAQVVDQHVWKRYGEPARAEVAVVEL